MADRASLAPLRNGAGLALLLAVGLTGCGGGSEREAQVGRLTQERDEARAKASQAVSDLRTAQDVRAQAVAEADGRAEDAEAALETEREKLKEREAELKEREAAVASTERQAAANSFEGDGTYIVGEDVRPGTYKSSGGHGCYWARLDRDEEIIDNNLSDGPAVLTIKSSDAQVRVSGCAAFQKR